MPKRNIYSQSAPEPVGPYSQAIAAKGFIFTAGQIPVDPKTNRLESGGVKDQTRLVLENLKAVLSAGGSSLEKVVKTTVFLKNIDDFPKMNEVYAQYFPKESAPARSTVEVSRLPKDVLIEIEAVAII